MRGVRRLTSWIATLAFLALGACAAPPGGGPGHYEPDQVVELTRAIEALGPGVDPAEAARAARIAYTHTAELARRYEITDPPLIHNMKVNAGLKPRGLCWHWAEDIEARLDAEGFETLEMHRAIANADHPIFIDHSTAIISARGDDMFDGIVLDPWRKGGILTWNATLGDPKYTWVPQAVVHERRRERMLRDASVAGAR